ncbi:hypothetical protein EV424DRAFT_1341553 [Suillus variegatus]|nr:hypothetical protein EV424DRAFT_1341553 [Suillus variegatus]
MSNIFSSSLTSSALQKTLPPSASLCAWNSLNARSSFRRPPNDVQLSLVAFQKAQQVSAECQRTVVEDVKIAVEDEYERDHHDELLESSEAEIEEIESGIGGMLDNIESNVFNIAADTQGVAEELSAASEYQHKAG